MRGRCTGEPWLLSQSLSPGKGPWPCRGGPAGPLLPLHCSRWETSSAALLSLQGSRPCARSFLIWRVKRYLWRGQEHALGGAGCWAEPRGPCLFPNVIGCTATGSQDEHAAPAEGCSWAPVGPTYPCSLVDFKINIPFCFGGHLPLLGLTFCRSTVLVLFLVPVGNAFSKIVEANNVIFKNKTKVFLSEHCLRQELD